MAICKVCGTRFEDGKRFCPSCGEPSTAAKAAALSTTMTVCKVCGTRYIDSKRFCPQCGAHRGSTPTPGEKPSVGSADMAAVEIPMKWHHILLILLMLGGAINIIGGLLTMFGQQYTLRGLDAGMIYRQIPNMKFLDVVSGAFCIGMGIFQFVVSKRLSGLYRNGPNLLTILYVITLGFGLFYFASASSILGVSTFGRAVWQFMGTAVLLIVNRVYYSNRGELFVN